MTCLEAQSNIMAFVDKKLPDDKISDFVRHMRYCPNCAEELEIYYTLIVGMRQLDNNENLSHNFKKDLNDELTKIDNRVKNAKRFKISTFSIVFVAMVIGVMIFYNSCLHKVYKIEQMMIKEDQGQHYFYDYYGEYIGMCKEDLIAEAKQNSKPVEKTFYEKIHSYNLTHPVWIDVEGEEDSLDE